MKTTMKILTSGLMLLALVMVSCQKEETENDRFIEKTQEEEFMSKTGNSDSEIETTSEVLTPLLHKRYDASLSKEEAAALFDIEVSKFKKENGHDDKPSTYFYFIAATKTGTLSHSQTDGVVKGRFNFLTDKGQVETSWKTLNLEGDDRENGAWDYYYIASGHIDSVNWVECKNASLALKGTDGWYLEFFNVYVRPSNQAPGSGATGGSFIFSVAQTWLDNTTSGGWDYYHTGNVGFGTINF